MIGDVLPDDELVRTTQDLARDMLSRSFLVVVALTRQFLWRMLGLDHPMEAPRVDYRLITRLGPNRMRPRESYRS